MNDAKKTFLVKIIPPTGYSVYRLAFTRRHVALLGAALLLALLAAAGFHTYQLRVAEANVRALQAVTAEQQTKLQSDRQAGRRAREPAQGRAARERRDQTPDRRRSRQARCSRS